jgi:outer membrane protein TolC
MNPISDNLKTLNRILIAVILVCVGALSGCRSNKAPRFHELSANAISQEAVAIGTVASSSEFPVEYPTTERIVHSGEYGLPPLTSADELPEAYDLSLDEALQVALSNTKILRSLGAQLLANPNSVGSVFAPAIQSTDPLLGIEAALSQFDANLSASLNHANNDDVFNNSALGGGATEVVQDLTSANFGIQKTAATGTLYSVRSNVTYDNNTSPAITFPSSYNSFWEAQVRHPLLQGRGVDFNRIAGPNARPGFRNTQGVILSRIDNDLSIARFELDVRQYVDEVIREYWNLYFAYRNFESTKLARDTTLETWNNVKSRFDNELAGGEADKEAQAREQYYLFEQQLLAALNGDPLAGQGGILQAEANLRRLIGLPQSDGRLLRPADKPAATKSVFDWDALTQDALDNRVEVRSQLWQVKRRELENLAARNFLLPRLDAVATYRNNGFGDDLFGGGSRFSSAFSDMSTGDHNEWEMGLQLNVPIGYRQASAGVRHSELRLRRERAVLEEQEKQILHDLGSAVRQSEQYGSSVEIAFNRMKAALDTVKARQAGFQADKVTLDLLLESQRRLAEAQTAFYRSQVNLQLAQESVHRESGNLLTSHSISFGQSEMASLARSYQIQNDQPYGRVARRLKDLDYRIR